MRTGIVDVGGGLRGIYAAGILDYCMVQDIRFDCCIGVSAGSANRKGFQLAGELEAAKPSSEQSRAAESRI